MSKINYNDSIKVKGDPDACEFVENLTDKALQDPKLSDSMNTITLLKQEVSELRAGDKLIVNLTSQLQTQMGIVLNLRAKMISNVMLLGGNIENKADGDDNYIKSFGFVLRAKGSKNTEVPAIPQGLAAFVSDTEGEIDLQWDSNANTSNYNIQICPDPLNNSAWTFVKSTPKTSATLNGLQSGQKFWFRVQAVNGNGESGWSDPVGKKVY